MKGKIFSLISILFLLINLQGQVQFEIEKINVDSLQQVLPKLDGTQKIDALNKLSLGLCIKLPDSSRSIAKNTIILSEKLEYKKGQADGYFNLGSNYYYRDSLKPMVLNHLNALRIYEEIEPCLEMGLGLAQLSEVNRLIGRYDKAKEYTKKAIHTHQVLSEHKYEIWSWLDYGTLCSYNQEYDSAIYYYDIAKELLMHYPNDYLKGSVIFSYGWTYIYKYVDEKEKGVGNLKDLDMAISMTLKSNEIDNKLLTAKSISLAQSATGIYNLGSFYIRTDTKENIEKGVALVKKAQSIIDTMYIPVHLKLMSNHRLAIVERDKGNYKNAITLLKNGLVQADTCMEHFSMKNYKNPYGGYTDKYYTKLFKNYVYWQLYDIYKELGDYKTALEYYTLKGKAAEKIFEEDNRKLVDMLEAESENEKTEKQIALLARDNDLKEIRVTNSKYINIGVTLLFIVLLFIGLFFIRVNKLKNEHKNVLLEQKLLRLQMNPHFIFNAFSNILRLIETNENKRASAYLLTFGKLLRTTLESTREDMVPFEKEVGTLTNYLELQKFRYSDKFEYSLDIDEKIDQEEMSIPPMLVQPFIENAIEHGIRHKKTLGKIDVRFELKGKKIVCNVEDDGVGREKAWEAEYAERGKRKSLATEIIRDRIKVLNKRLKQKIKLEIIDKYSNNMKALGTKVVLDLPYGMVY